MTELRLGDLGMLPFSSTVAELKAAADATLREAEAEVARVAAPSGSRTVENTLDALNRALVQIVDLGNHGRFLFSVHPDAALREAGRGVSEEADRFFNGYRVNRALYDALAEVDLKSADTPTRFAVEKMRREMRRSGVELNAETRAQLQQLNDKIDRLSNEFAENIARLVRTVEVSDPAQLDGLPEDYRAAHPPGPDGAIRITTQYPDVLPVLAYARSGELRRKALHEFLNRAYPENLPVLDELLRCRYELARVLGYAEYATYVIEDKMMKTPAAAHEFLDRVATTVRDQARADLELFLARKRKDDPAAKHLDPWDANIWCWEGYYDAKVRSEQFGVDTKVLREYLPYPRVRDGLFGLCERLFGLRFEPVQNAGLWHPSVEAFDVRRDGRPLGRCYLDLVPREGKYGHAAQFDLRCGIQGLQLPQAALVCNFLDPKIPADQALMQYSDVVTFFHEFGHLLHALFSGHGRWLYNTQGFVEWDFIEAPSQLFEEWARDLATLREFARHPTTGAPIPEELLERLKAAESVGRASRWLVQVAYSAISLDLYERDPAHLDTTERFREVYRRYALLPPPEDCHFQAAWGHLTGYSAIYYTYTWSLVIARDLLRPFQDKGTLTDPETARRYAEEILIPGGSRTADELIRRYLGRPFDFRAFESWVLAGATALPVSPPPLRTP
ncbi:MAG: Zn-dependent oligopeptidase [Thermoplasmata archaeon]|nr:Zn-dependent oligopeptidase [Thermoplasmata archaeon]